MKTKEHSDTFFTIKTLLKSLMQDENVEPQEQEQFPTQITFERRIYTKKSNYKGTVTYYCQHKSKRCRAKLIVKGSETTLKGEHTCIEQPEQLVGQVVDYTQAMHEHTVHLSQTTTASKTEIWNTVNAAAKVAKLVEHLPE